MINNNNINKVRTELGISQRELGRRIGKTGQYISYLEGNNNSNPSLDVLEKIADALNVQINYLIGTSEYKEYDSQELQNNVINIIKSADMNDSTYSKLIRSTIDTTFLTINDFHENKDYDSLKIINALYKNIFELKVACKNSKFYNSLSLADLDNIKNSFVALKEIHNNLFDELYKSLTRQEDNK
jgi:transcriptional regulator with XRE-family HTH domain